MMEPVGWFVWTEENGYEEVAKAFEGEEWTTPLVRLSDAEARIAELEADKTAILQAIKHHSGSDHGLLGIRLLVERAEAAEALLKEAKTALEPFLRQLEALHESWPDDWRLDVLNSERWHLKVGDFRAARAISDKIGVKDE